MMKNNILNLLLGIIISTTLSILIVMKFTVPTTLMVKESLNQEIFDYCMNLPKGYSYKCVYWEEEYRIGHTINNTINEDIDRYKLIKHLSQIVIDEKNEISEKPLYVKSIIDSISNYQIYFYFGKIQSKENLTKVLDGFSKEHYHVKDYWGPDEME